MIQKDSNNTLKCLLDFSDVQGALDSYNKSLNIFSAKLQTNLSSNLKNALFEHTINHMVSFLDKVSFHGCLKIRSNIQTCIDEFKNLANFGNILRNQFSNNEKEKHDLIEKLHITQAYIDKYIRNLRLLIPITQGPAPSQPSVPPDDYSEIYKKLPKENCCVRIYNAIFK